MLVVPFHPASGFFGVRNVFDPDVYYPFGFLCGNGHKNCHGNIFLDDWEDLLTISNFLSRWAKVLMKNYAQMDKEQRKWFKVQQTQLAILKTINS
jgi:hypothetical protein